MTLIFTPIKNFPEFKFLHFGLLPPAFFYGALEPYDMKN